MATSHEPKKLIKTVHNKNANSFLSWFTLFRRFVILIVGYFVYALIRIQINQASLNDPDAVGKFYSIDTQSLIDITIFYTAVGVIVWFISKGKLAYNDYKSKNIAYIMLSTGYVFILGQIWFEHNPSNPARYGKGQYILLLLDLMVLPAIVVSHMIKLVLSSTDKLAEQMYEISSEVKNGNYEVRVTNQRLLNDSLFGPISEMLNSMLETTMLVLNRIQELTKTVSYTTEQLSASSEEVNSSSHEVAQISQGMAQGASQQAEVVASVNINLRDLENIITEITEEIKNNADGVTQISLQTNILALNAGIEASRAGDYGRGFAVVAENVRKLSDETKTLAEKIGSTIENINQSLKASLSENRNMIESVAAVSEETAASSEEVAAAAEEVTSSMSEVTELSMTLSSMLTETSQLLKGLKVEKED